MTDDQIKHMVDRFLCWKLPAEFSPDAGISFEPEFNKEYMASQGKPPMRHEPTGTNLFCATQAEAMIRHLVQGLPDAEPPIGTPISELSGRPGHDGFAEFSAIAETYGHD